RDWSSEVCSSDLASVYKQHIPLVNAIKKPGDWHSYDIIGTVGLESRRCPDDIVAMPVARFLYGIHQRDMLLINTGRLPVHIGFIVKHIEHLNFIQALHKDTTVAPTLAFTFDDQRAAPFDVELVAFEMLARFNIALTGLDCHGTLFYGPSGRLV